jgi:hypothetical protein
VDICSKDMPTLAPHLSRHGKGIHEEERFSLEDHRKSVRGNDRILAVRNHTDCVDLRNLRKSE